MHIDDICESGANNILMWAIANGADLRTDTQLQSLINDETFYLIKVSNLNYLEVFRLVQIYREKVRILNEKRAEIPSHEELTEMFSSSSIERPNPDNEDETTNVALTDVAEYAASRFMDLVMQMQSDDDIIRPETIRLFIPMLCRRFDVQIPISFIDLISGLQSDEEFAEIFNSNYPNNLVHQIIESEHSGIRNLLYIGLLKSTSIIRYQQHYEQLIKITKYAQLSKVKNDELYKFRMIGFYKYDPIYHSEVRCSLFQTNKDKMAQSMKRLSHINTPLKVEFVVQLPIMLMEMLMNTFSREELQVSYESSMSSIIDGGINFHNFKTHEWDVNSEDPDIQQKVHDYENAIEAYDARIAEANQIVLNAISILINSGEEVDITSIFALLPPIYNAKAVITLDTSKFDLYKKHFATLETLGTMISEMMDIVGGLQSNILSYKNK